MNTTRTAVFTLAAVAAVTIASAISAQQPAGNPGPLVESGGRVFDVPHIDLATPLEMTYRVAFDLSRASTSATAVNAGLDSVARLLNMQARAGVSASQLHLAVVVHGGAAADLLSHDAYRARTGESNPNAALIDELAKAGVRFIALSAMTAFAVLQERGYHVNPF